MKARAEPLPLAGRYGLVAACVVSTSEGSQMMTEGSLISVAASNSRRTMQGCLRVLAFVLATLSVSSVQADAADALKPKLGPLAVTIQQSHEYLRTHEAPDYWAL